MESVITKLSEIEIAAERIMDYAQQQKKEMEKEMEQRSAKFDVQVEADTAAREIREETGLTARVDTSFRQMVTYYPKSGVVKDVIFFLASPTGGTEHAQEEEIAQIGWFSFQEARSLVTFATDEEVLLAAESCLAQRAAET